MTSLRTTIVFDYLCRLRIVFIYKSFYFTFDVEQQFAKLDFPFMG